MVRFVYISYFSRVYNRTRTISPILGECISLIGMGSLAEWKTLLIENVFKSKAAISCDIFIINGNTMKIQLSLLFIATTHVNALTPDITAGPHSPISSKSNC